MKSFFTIAALAGASLAAPQINKRTPVGQIITSCTDKTHVALTFDDGPMDYTISLLDKLEAAGHKGTFFLNGNNWGYIYDYASTINRFVSGSHQVCSHTWSHADLTAISRSALYSEMCQIETALQAIAGFVPKCMRPPFLAYNSTTLSDLGTMGYRVISIDIDTLDWEYQADNPKQSETNYIDGYNAGGTISLNHDVYKNSVDTIVPYIINFLATKGKKSVTVAECLGETVASWNVQGVGSYCPVSSSSSSSSRSSTSSSSIRSSTSSNSITSSSTSTGSSSSSASSSSVSSSSSVRSTTTSSTPASSSSSSTSSRSSVISSSSSISSQSSSASSTSSPVSSSSSSSSRSSSVSSVNSQSSSVSSSVSSTSSSTSSVSSVISRSSSSSVVSSVSSRTSSVSQVSSVSSRTSSAPASSSSASGMISPDDTCGGTKGYRCPNGQCCSQYGWCGTSTAYCSTGCQTNFGACTSTMGSGSTGTTGSSGSTASTSIDPNGTCGGASGFVCATGECCSKYGYCGSGSAYCS